MKKTMISLRCLLAYIPQKRKYVTSLILASFFPILYNTVIGLLLRRAFIAVGFKDRDRLLSMGLVLILAIIGIYLYNGLTWIFFGSQVAKTTGHMRSFIFNHALGIPLQHIYGNSTSLLSLLSADVDAMEGAYAQHLRIPVGAILSGIFSSVIVLVLSWQIGLVIILSALVHLNVNIYFIKPLKKYSDDIQRNIAKTVQTASVILSGTLTIKLTGSDKWQYENYLKYANRLKRLQIKRGLLLSIINAGNVLFGLFSFMAIIVLGKVLSQRGIIELPELILIIQMRAGMYQVITSFGDFAIRLQSALSGAERIFKILDSPTE